MHLVSCKERKREITLCLMSKGIHKITWYIPVYTKPFYAYEKFTQFTQFPMYNSWFNNATGWAHSLGNANAKWC